MKTDTIFYQLFLAFPGIFFELIGQNPEEARGYEFTSIEVKQVSFRIDGLFLPTSDEAHQPFYIVEVQFQPDKELYYRLFGELFAYIRRCKPLHPWRVVVIYPSRRVEREEALQFGEMLALSRVRRIYLDELGAEASSSLGVGAVKLVIEEEETSVALAKRLIEQAKQELTDEAIKRDFIDLIETIIVYKLPKKSRKEIEEMLRLSELKQTKVYQEALEEGKQIGETIGEQIGEQKAKLEAVARMLRLGLSLEMIAESLDLPLEVVQQAAPQSNH